MEGCRKSGGALEGWAAIGYAPEQMTKPYTDVEIVSKLVPGANVRVTQQIAARDYTWTTEVKGTVVRYEQRSTGSWYAHSKNEKLWLDRLVLKKADGEISILNLDAFSHVDVEV